MADSRKHKVLFIVLFVPSVLCLGDIMSPKFFLFFSPATSLKQESQKSIP